MDLFFLSCYVSTLLTAVNSYVLLAANLDDFRTIAKKFVPKNFAEQIVELAQGSEMNSRLPAKDDTAEYSEESQQTYEMTTEGFKRGVPPRNVPRFEMKIAPPASPAPAIAAAPLMSLDEIVEKVKQRLQTELLNRGALAAGNNRNVKLAARIAPPQGPAPAYDYKSPVNEDQEDIQYEEVNENNGGGQQMASQQYPLQKKRIVDRNKQGLTQNVYMNPHQGVIIPVAGQKNVRYAPQVLVQPNVQQQSILQQPKRIGFKQKIIKKKQLTRLQSSQPLLQTAATKKELEATTETNIGIFEAVDMRKSNDSYEDYVTPAKEEAFESEPEAPTKFVPLVITLKPKPIIRTTTLSSTAAVESLVEGVGDNGAQQAMEYEYETPESTPEPKAKTESISYEEKETKPDPNVTTIAEAKGKITKKSKMGTMIPTREFYKLSSPNYYAKLPTIAEKYNFDEPIPEKDREPENLKPIGNPPASINGKVLLLK